MGSDDRPGAESADLARAEGAASQAAGEAWALAPDDYDDAGPPWLVAAACPYCNAPVDQRSVAVQRQPQCPTCGQALISYSLVADEIGREDLS